MITLLKLKTICPQKNFDSSKTMLLPSRFGTSAMNRHRSCSCIDFQTNFAFQLYCSPSNNSPPSLRYSCLLYFTPISAFFPPSSRLLLLLHSNCYNRQPNSIHLMQAPGRQKKIWIRPCWWEDCSWEDWDCSRSDSDEADRKSVV